MRSLLQNRLYRAYACIAAVVAIITSYTNFGHFCGDEYSQILEFAGWKLGQVQHAELRLWEFDSQMRPTIQIWMVVGVWRLLGLVTAQVNPFLVSYLINVLSGLFSIVSILVFTGAFIHRVSPRFRNAFVVLSLFTWLVLYTNTHFNSENICGHLFLLAVGLFYAGMPKPGAGRLVIVGILLGLSFSCRFQIGFAILGLMTWFSFAAWKERLIGRWLLLAAGLLLSVLIFNVLADSLFYGKWVFTPYSYYYQNIATGTMNRASGVSPWFTYLAMLAALLPFGPAYIVSTAHQFLRYRRDLLTWIIAPFVLFHFVVGHKEGRFLLPMLGFMPVLIMITLEDLSKPGSFLERHQRRIIGVSWIANLAACVSLLFPSATEIGGWRYLYTHYQKPTILYFNASVHQKLLFYKRPNVRVIEIKTGDPTPLIPGYNCLLAVNANSRDSKPALAPVYTFFPPPLERILPSFITRSVGHFNLYELKGVEAE